MLDLIVDDDFYDDDSDDVYFYPVHGSVSSRVENYAKTKKTFSIGYSLFFGPPSLPEHNISVVGNRNYSEPYLIPMQ